MSGWIKKLLIFNEKISHHAGNSHSAIKSYLLPRGLAPVIAALSQTGTSPTGKEGILVGSPATGAEESWLTHETVFVAEGDKFKRRVSE